jgi:hypothetical protein
MTREEAITILNMVEAHGSLVVQAKDMAIKALEQEPKTGHWWERDTYPQECECWDCSECQETVFERTNYCPNCGARMESEKE